MARKEGLTQFMPSRLFAYYNMRTDKAQDTGASIRDGVATCAREGLPPESDWEYDISKFTQQPPVQAYTDGALNVVTRYLSVTQDLNTLKAALAAGYVIPFGFSVSQNFETGIGPDGNVPMPQGQVLDGHADLLVGYDDATQRFISRNSWGTGFGDHGYLYFPYAFITDPAISSDFWAIELVVEPGPTPSPTPTPLVTSSMVVGPHPQGGPMRVQLPSWGVRLLAADGSLNTSDNSKTVSYLLRDETTQATYNGVRSAKAVNGVVTFPGDTFSYHSGPMHYEVSALGLLSVASSTFVVAAGPTPPPPSPTPVKTHQVDIYSDGSYVAS